MGEKVLFEFRVGREGGGYRFEFRRPGWRRAVKSRISFRGIACRPRGAFWAGCLRWMGRSSDQPYPGARKTLDALERMYRDVYGEESMGAKPEAGAGGA